MAVHTFPYGLCLRRIRVPRGAARPRRNMSRTAALSPLLFVFYRNADAGWAATSLYWRLSRALEPGQVFLAEHSIQGGDPWRARDPTGRGPDPQREPPDRHLLVRPTKAAEGAARLPRRCLEDRAPGPTRVHGLGRCDPRPVPGRPGAVALRHGEHDAR